jgi:hypothetical protein
MKGFHKIALWSGICGVLGLVGVQTPALARPSGTALAPSTDILPGGTARVDVFTSRAEEIDLDLGDDVFTGVEFGAGPDRDGLFGRTEVGFDYLFKGKGYENSLSDNERFAFDFKTQLFGNDPKGTRLVAGAWQVGRSSTNVPQAQVGYLSGSKVWSWGRLGLGVHHAFGDAFAASVAPARRTALHASYEQLVSKKFHIIVEHMTGEALGGTALTAYYYFNYDFSLQVGALRGNGASGVWQVPTLQLEHRFSTK